MVTVSLAHFIRNLDFGDVKGQPEVVGKRALRGWSSALTSFDEQMMGALPHELHLGSVSLLFGGGIGLVYTALRDKYLSYDTIYE